MDDRQRHSRCGIEGLPIGRVAGLASDRKHRFSKRAQHSLNFREGLGIEDDAHAGRFVRHRYLARYRPTMLNMRQVHLIPAELLDTLRREGNELGPGDLGENVLTVGLDLEIMPLGTTLRLGSAATVELTGLRTPCVLIDRFRSGLKQQMIIKQQERPTFRCGVMAVVRSSGTVTIGDTITIEFPAEPFKVLPAL